jgi:iron complex outermembrane receptor protein
LRTVQRLWKIGFLASASVIGLTSPALAQDATSNANSGDEEIVVLGSRIPRVNREGPAPVTTITADEIRAGGYASVPDVLRTVSQNSGEVQTVQSNNAADFSPGAAQVDLRGLGPNHTLVMVNGRRIADYPMPFNGSANFTNIGNIPLGMIENVQILSGSASAIYGSDALAGVVNFVLKDRADETTLDYRYGFTEHGGGESHRFSGSTGFDFGAFHGVIGGEILMQDPIFGYQRERQDSTLDAPIGSGYEVPVTNWQRLDQDLYYANDATEAQCALTTGTNEGTTHYAIDDYYGDGGSILGAYCGSESAIGYRSLQSETDAINLIGSLTYDLNARTSLFIDVQFGYSELQLLKRPTSWGYQDNTTGDDTGSFFNSFDGIGDNWYRIFTPEEMGGLDEAMRHVDSTTLTLTPGIRGSFGADDRWRYEAALNYSVYDAEVTFPLINSRRANDFFLGPQTGVTNGLPEFNADPIRFYTPVTPEEYATFAEDSIYKPRSSLLMASAQIDTSDLFSLPAGPVGFAAIAEIGQQDYDLGTDPRAIDPYYFSWVDSPGEGDRQSWAVGAEFKAPIFSTLDLNVAGRYDNFTYASHDVGQGTYNVGLEYRPLNSLLLRAAFGTGFRAPDLNYVFKGVGYVEGGGADYFDCFTADPDAAPSDCDDGERYRVQTSGSEELEPETSESFNIGFVWAPTRTFDISVDYFDIEMEGVVEDMEVDPIVRDEGECRVGRQDINSPTCQDAIARVIRNADGDSDIDFVIINPINLAREATTGIDIAANFRFDTSIGQFGVTGSYTHVLDHTYTRFAGDSEVDKLAVDSDYYIPRDKASLSVRWENGPLSLNTSASYISGLPNYDEDAWVNSYITFNSSVAYDFTEQLTASFAVTNLFDEEPPRDETWVSYPYYYSSWYDGIGRSGFLQLTYRLQ